MKSQENGLPVKLYYFEQGDEIKTTLESDSIFDARYTKNCYDR